METHLLITWPVGMKSMDMIGFAYQIIIISLSSKNQNPDKWPLLIPGEEVTANAGTNLGKSIPVHINAYGTDRLITPSNHNSVIETLQENISRIISSGAMASVNHPNYKWAFGLSELLQVDGYRFIEIFNGHPGSNSFGGSGYPSVETIWDGLLSVNRRILGIAVDDAHHFDGEFAPDRSNPGRGWIQVKAKKSSRDAILEAMSNGNFYASNGVTITDMKISKTEINIEIEPEDSTAHYTTKFHGRGGRILDSIEGLSPRYSPNHADLYVRATVTSSKATKAWTQPIYI